MSKVNQSAAPYYNDYDSNKQYTQLLALPGRVAQAREITQIQSVVKDIVKSVGDSILKDGNVIEGCQVNINASKTTATVSPGKVYLNGMVLPVNGGVGTDGELLPISVEITGKETETIGFILRETLITEYEDNTLRDPAQGYDNFNQPGCHRIKSEVDIVVNDPASAILVTLIDGAIAVEKYAPDYDTLTQTLARRTYDESGSYIVEGLNVRIEANTNDASKINVVVESGKAYVLGYELKIPAARKIPLDRALSTIPVTRNTVYSGDYRLSEGEYVASITAVEGTLTHTDGNMSAPSSNTATQNIIMPENAIEFSDILSVSSGGTTYTKGVDYELILDGTLAYIRWKGTSKYPTASYTITYNYIARFIQGVDYELISVEGRHTLHWISGGSTPNEGQSLRIVYDQYLARKDIVYIDQYGGISIIQGTPAQYGLEVLPESPVNTLPLAHIYHSPGSQFNGSTVSNVGLTRFTMNDIQNLLRRVRNLEYNQVITSLQDDTRQRTVSGTKKSMFTDPLIDFSKVDYYYNLKDGLLVDETLPFYDATIDFESNICYLPLVSKSYDISYSSRSNTKNYGRLATLAKTGESVVLSQMNATKTFMINPYSAFPQLPEISLTPAVDSWIEESIITVPRSQNSSEVVTSSTRHLESSVVRGGSFENYTTTQTDIKDTAIGTRVSTSTSESVISEISLTYIRGREITVSGGNFPPMLDNIKCYFDGELIPIYPMSTTTAGTDVVADSDPMLGTGSIRSAADGTISARFTIPANKFLTGIREVRLETSTPGYDVEGSAFALYQASGTSRTIQRTVTTLTTVLLNRVITVNSTTYIDPVAQTFVLDRMTMVSGIDVYFASAPTADTPVTCDIREVVNGNITPNILAHKTLSASQVRPYLSSDSRTATRFEFDDPVLLEENKEYAFVLRSTSTEYRVWVANLGENDILTGESVVSNPYLIGVMMSSSNNSSWTTHQTSDIKFRLIADQYSMTNEMFFDDITADDYSRIYLIADSIIPEGTSISWYYSTDSGVNYNPISPYYIKLLNKLEKNLSIRAVLNRGSNPNLSPIVAIDSISASLSRYDLSGKYLSLEFPGNDYNRVDIIVDTYLPNDSVSMKIYVSNDNGETLIDTTLQSTESLNYGWSESVYKAIMPTESSSCKVIIEMSSTSAYQTPAFSKLRAITYTE